MEKENILPDGWLDWNKLSLEEMVKYLENKHMVSSTGESRCIFELISFYKENRPEKEDIYKKAVDKWGVEAQMNMIVEELSELTFALMKIRRSGTEQQKIDRYDNLCEEIADVKLMLKQAEYMFDKKKIDKYYKEKKEYIKNKLNED